MSMARVPPWPSPACRAVAAKRRRRVPPVVHQGSLPFAIDHLPFSVTTITANINRAGQRKRLIGGIASIVIGVMLLVLLHQTGASRWWRLLVFPSFWLGSLGVIQAQART